MRKRRGKKVGIFKYIFLMFLLTVTSVGAVEILNVNLKGEIEYGVGEEVMIFAYVTNNTTGVPYGLTSANNSIIIYNPNRTVFIASGMRELGNGTYYSNFTAPSTEGIYMVYDNASYNNNWTVGLMSFHIAPWKREITEAMNRLINELTGIQSTIADIKKYTDSIPIISDGVNSMTSWFYNFKINFNNAYILGLTIIFIIMFGIMTASFYTIDKIRHKEEKEKVVGYLG